jgi:hypothetical protein
MRRAAALGCVCAGLASLAGTAAFAQASPQSLSPASKSEARPGKPVIGSLAPADTAPMAFGTLPYAATPQSQSLSIDSLSPALQAISEAQRTPTGFYADVGAQAGAATRRARHSGATVRVLPSLGIGYGDAFSADTNNGAWLKAGNLGSFGFGPALTLDRHISASKRGNSRITDVFGSAKAGAFLNYQQNGAEWGRLTVSSGTPILGSEPGLDIKATRTFSLGDTVMVSLGPTLSFNEYKRTDLIVPQFSTTRLAATGATFQLEKELGRNLTATVTANYAILHPTPNSNAQTPGGRNRYDFGIALTRRFGGE